VSPAQTTLGGAVVFDVHPAAFDHLPPVYVYHHRGTTWALRLDRPELGSGWRIDQWMPCTGWESDDATIYDSPEEAADALERRLLRSRAA